jgi:hypothetical protein
MRKMPAKRAVEKPTVKLFHCISANDSNLGTQIVSHPGL